MSLWFGCLYLNIQYEVSAPWHLHDLYVTSDNKCRCSSRHNNVKPGLPSKTEGIEPVTNDSCLLWFQPAVISAVLRSPPSRRAAHANSGINLRQPKLRKGEPCCLRVVYEYISKWKISSKIDRGRREIETLSFNLIEAKCVSDPPK